MRGIIQKRGQFFILAAVIISSIVLSLGVISNYALTSNNPTDFEKFSHGIKKETGEVVDYSIYSGFSNDEDLKNFIDLLSTYVSDKEPDSSFIFIYGNRKSITLENHGTESASISAGDDSADASAGGSKIKSKITIGGAEQEVFETYDYLGGNGSKIVLDNGGLGFSEGSKVNITVSSRQFSFPISNNTQVIFLIQKEEENDIYIAAK